MSRPRHLRDESHRKIAADHLKRCPLCGAVNTEEAHECFVCCWHGEFDRNPESIIEGLDDLVNSCPMLQDIEQVVPTIWDRFNYWWHRLTRKGFDLRI